MFMFYFLVEIVRIKTITNSKDEDILKNSIYAKKKVNFEKKLNFFLLSRRANDFDFYLNSQNKLCSCYLKGFLIMDEDPFFSCFLKHGVIPKSKEYSNCMSRCQSVKQSMRHFINHTVFIFTTITFYIIYLKHRKRLIVLIGKNL